MGAAAALSSGLDNGTSQYPYAGLDQSAYLNVLQNAAYSQSQAALQQNAGLLAQMKKSGYDVWNTVKVHFRLFRFNKDNSSHTEPPVAILHY